ncbi:AraC family transcriptional regulator [Aurantimonas sp. A2-1-M11]|uniref:AraC family transcriptional regulator n=1 Tax=Aurantimonas sp. A2-1-M11 TaxID=3113712 RepID=UPI002F93BCB2
MLRRIAAGSGQEAGIGSAIALIRARYAGTIRASELARVSRMSVASFYRRFKAETDMSSLRYRTTIRLYETRRRLLASPGNVAAVAYALGYESASQFSQEYARVFGHPPMRDAPRIRASMAAA